MPRIATGMIRLMGDDCSSDESSVAYGYRNQRAIEEFWSLVNHYEDVMSTLLPEGYYIKVDDTTDLDAKLDKIMEHWGS